MAEVTMNEDSAARQNHEETGSNEITTEDDIDDEVVILNEEAPNVDYEDGEPDRMFKNPRLYKYHPDDSIEKGCFVDLHCWTETSFEVG